MNIIKRDILTLLRDKMSLFINILFPAMLVFLLGTLLQNLDDSDFVIKPIILDVTVETRESFELVSINSFIEALENHETITLNRQPDHEAARQRVDENTTSAAIVFTEPFGIEIYQGHDQTQNRAIDSIFRSFIRQTASMRVLAKEAPTQLSQAVDLEIQELVKQKEFGYNRSMLDYYAVTMMILILFMAGSMSGAGNLYDSRNDGTLNRMLASSENRVKIYISTVFGAIPQTILQVACVMTASVLLFDAHYADTAEANILLFFTMFIVGIAIIAFFMIVGLFVRFKPLSVILPLMWVMLFLSGTFSKEIYIKGISEMMPVWQLQNAVFDLTVFGREEKCLFILLISAGGVVLFTFIGALLFNRKGVVIK